MGSIPKCLRQTSALAWLVAVASPLGASASAWAGEPDSAASPPAASPESSPAAAATTSGEPAGVPGEYLRELKSVEQSVHDLKERVFQSKATLQLLHELVVEGVAFDAAVSVWHSNDLARAYTIEGIEYFLDGKSVYTWKRQGEKEQLPREVEIRNQEVEAGKHTLQVSMDVRGNGGGVFTYVKDYAVSVQSSYDFEVATGRRTILFAHPTSKGGVKKAYSERPSFVYEERVEDLPEN
jgi:hypothetical protein